MITRCYVYNKNYSMLCNTNKNVTNLENCNCLLKIRYYVCLHKLLIIFHINKMTIFYSVNQTQEYKDWVIQYTS